MPHENHDDARRSRGDKLNRMTGQRGEYPPDRAARIAQAPGYSAKPMDADTFIGAPARQVSITGEVKGA